MAKLYLFAIGGSGARVLKSLCMLFAAGCKLPQGFDTVVPVLIDPDEQNGNLLETTSLLENYQSLRAHIENPSGFFAQKVRTLGEVTDDPEIRNTFCFPIEKGSMMQSFTFDKYIGYDALGQEDKLFIDMLFSEEQRHSDMSIGFTGNPNMGAVVLEQICRTPQYRDFGNTFAQGDAIFLISSIFGGTGAAGFPMLVNELRNPKQNMPGGALIANAPIGALSLTPYFNVRQDTNSPIDSDKFKQKSAIALNYYGQNLANKLEALYIIGNDESEPIEQNEKGGGEQRNKACFIEMAAALTIFDFCSINNYKRGTIREFDVLDKEKKRITSNINLVNLSRNNLSYIANQLARFKFLYNYHKYGLSGAGKWMQTDKQFDEFFNGAEKTVSESFTNYQEWFQIWLDEMRGSSPSFTPFYEDKESKDALKFIQGISPQSRGMNFLSNPYSFSSFEKECNKSVGSLTNTSNGFTKYLELTARAMDKVFEEKGLIIK